MQDSNVSVKVEVGVRRAQGGAEASRDDLATIAISQARTTLDKLRKPRVRATDLRDAAKLLLAAKSLSACGFQPNRMIDRTPATMQYTAKGSRVRVWK